MYKQKNKILKTMYSLFVSILICTILLTNFSFAANGASDNNNVLTSGNWEYVILDKETAGIVRYNGNEEKVVVPAKIGNYKVEEVGFGYYEDFRAFWKNGSNTNEITFSEGIKKINFHSTSNSNIKKINLPGSIENISEEDIDDIRYFSLDYIEVSKQSNVYYSDNGVLCEINEDGTRKLLIYPEKKLDTDYTVPNNINIIGKKAFNSCQNLETLRLSSSVTQVEKDAIYYNYNLKEIYLSSSVTDIKGSSIDDCYNLENITVDENNSKYKSIDGVLFEKRAYGSVSSGNYYYILVKYPSGKEDESYTVPETVGELSEYAFADCNNLKNVQLSNNGIIHTIPEGAFENCIQLENINIPNSVEYIGKRAFYGCGEGGNYKDSDQGLKNFVIPNSVEEIDENAFSFCCFDSNLKIEMTDGIINTEAFSRVNIFISAESNIIQIPDILNKAQDIEYNFKFNSYVQERLNEYKENYPEEFEKYKQNAYEEYSNSFQNIQKFYFDGCKIEENKIILIQKINEDN